VFVLRFLRGKKKTFCEPLFLLSASPALAHPLHPFIEMSRRRNVAVVSDRLLGPSTVSAPSSSSNAKENEETLTFTLLQDSDDATNKWYTWQRVKHLETQFSLDQLGKQQKGKNRLVFGRVLRSSPTSLSQLLGVVNDAQRKTKRSRTAFMSPFTADTMKDFAASARGHEPFRLGSGPGLLGTVLDLAVTSLIMQQPKYNVCYFPTLFMDYLQRSPADLKAFDIGDYHEEYVRPLLRSRGEDMCVGFHTISDHWYLFVVVQGEKEGESPRVFIYDSAFYAYKQAMARVPMARMAEQFAYYIDEIRYERKSFPYRKPVIVEYLAIEGDVPKHFQKTHRMCGYHAWNVLQVLLSNGAASLYLNDTQKDAMELQKTVHNAAAEFYRQETNEDFLTGKRTKQTD
jgi:hypothetical protein